MCLYVFLWVNRYLTPNSQEVVWVCYPKSLRTVGLGGKIKTQVMIVLMFVCALSELYVDKKLRFSTCPADHCFAFCPLWCVYLPCPVDLPGCTCVSSADQFTSTCRFVESWSHRFTSWFLFFSWLLVWLWVNVLPVSGDGRSQPWRVSGARGGRRECVSCGDDGFESWLSFKSFQHELLFLVSFVLIILWWTS